MFRYISINEKWVGKTLQKLKNNRMDNEKINGSAK